MGLTLGDTAELIVLLRLKDELSGKLSSIDRSLQGFNSHATTAGGALKKMGAGAVMGLERTAVLAGAAAVAVAKIGISATDTAMQYQAAMELLRTQTGASQAEVDAMSRSVIGLAPAVGTGPAELAAGLYHIESAGLRGSKALDMLRIAALGAKTGNADLESVTDALVGAWQSGVKGADNMQVAMGTLNAIVGSGNMRMQDLTDAMGTGILATAKTFGASMQSVGAAIATMTDEGIPAADAATRLRMTLSLLGAPTSKAADLFKGIGLSSTSLANAMRGPGGLVDAVTLLHDHMVTAGMIDKAGNVNTKGAQFLSGAFGGGRSSSAIMTLVGNYDLLIQKQQAVNEGAKGFGDAVAATEQTVAFKRAQMSAEFEALKTQLGTDLLPIESRVLDGLIRLFDSPAVKTGIEAFAKGLDSLFSADNVSQAEKFAENVIPQVEGFAKGTLPTLLDGLKLSGSIAKEAFQMFNALPEPLKAAVIAGLAANKLSGGLIGSGAIDLIKIAAGAGKGGVGGGAGGPGIVGGLLGVQRVYVVNMPPGGLGGGLGGAGGAAAAEEAAAGGWASKLLPFGMGAGAFGTQSLLMRLGGLGLVAGGQLGMLTDSKMQNPAQFGGGALATIAGGWMTGGPVGGIAASAAVLAESGKAFADNVGAAQAGTNQQISDWKAQATSQTDNIDALRSEIKTFGDVRSGPLGQFLTDTFASSQMKDAFMAAADKIAAGPYSTDGLKALQDALTTAQQGGYTDLADKIAADIAKYKTMPPADTGPGAASPQTPTGEHGGISAAAEAGEKGGVAGLRNDINRAANRAGRDVARQLAGQLDATKAIKDAKAIAAEFQPGMAKDTKWLAKDISDLKTLQARFTATGDTKTAASIGAEIKRLETVVQNSLSVTVNWSIRDVGTTGIKVARHGTIKAD